jgi:oligoendopeptidase F
VAAERDALVGILETAAGICAEIEKDSREGWEEAARLDQGVVVYPDHIQKGYDLLKEAGVDMATPEPYQAVVAKMNAIMDEMERLLDEKESM